MSATAPISRIAEPQEISDLRHPRMRPWLGWLVAFYTVWVVLNAGLHLWSQTRAHWPIGAAMVLGSYVAGSTPMGGGTVGFPVLVLLFDMPASLGRNFGLVIQSIGMTSASIFIFCRRTPVESRMLCWSILGSAAGLLAGTYLVVPFISDATVKLLFACIWVSFGILTLARNREICGFHRMTHIPDTAARNLGLVVGLAGGITTSATGVGIDMILYTVLVLLYRMDLKVAVPTSVIVMAVSSAMGTLLHFYIGDFSHELFYNWLAAAPVVILGAPLGAYSCSIVPRSLTLYFVAVLCVIQFFWTLHEVAPTAEQWVFVGVNLLIALLGFVLLYRVGKARAGY